MSPLFVITVTTRIVLRLSQKDRKNLKPGNTVFFPNPMHNFLIFHDLQPILLLYPDHFYSQIIRHFIYFIYSQIHKNT